MTGNSFEGNSAGGVFLYTNCGEYVNSRRDCWFERRFGADRNLIEGNTFTGGHNGIWVGSRMGRNTWPDGVQRRALSHRPFLEHRPRPRRRQRHPCEHLHRCAYGVHVEDDGTVVDHNSFTAPDPTHHAVVVGTPTAPPHAGRPVERLRLVGNSAAITGNDFPYRWVEGVRDIDVHDNSANGRTVDLCQGRTLPRSPFRLRAGGGAARPGPSRRLRHHRAGVGRGRRPARWRRGQRAAARHPSMAARSSRGRLARAPP